MKFKFLFTILFFVSVFSIRAETPITNGAETTIEANPHCVAIYYNGNFHCTASLINEKWLVGAAHCFKVGGGGASASNIMLSGFTVRLGATNRNSPDAVTRKIVSTVYSPSFDLPSNSLLYDSDFVLIELDCPVDFSDKISPIVIAGADITSVDAPNVVVGITGWGLDEDGDEVQNLRTAGTFTIGYFVACAVLDIPSYPLPMFSLSTLGPNKKNACSGDSGGPMTLDDQLVGVISGRVAVAGFDCEDNGTMYADLRSFKTFIETTIKLPDTEITENTIWNTDMDGLMDVTIKEGMKLTILNSMITMHQGAKISVERGGQIEINNSTLTTDICSDQWQGIVAEIDPDGLNPSTVYVYGGSVIENAKIGIQIGQIGYDQPFGAMGSIIAANTDFVNNVRGIYLGPNYQPNQSFINDCNFINNIAGIELNRNLINVDIQKCSFQGSPGSGVIDVGILSTESMMRVFNGNEFAGLTFGINSQGSFPLSTGLSIGDMEHAKNDFVNCSYGIRCVGNDFPLGANIINNLFDNNDTQGFTFWGANLGAVNNNTFDQCQNGVYCNATGNEFNRINCNVFTETVFSDDIFVDYSNPGTEFLGNQLSMENDGIVNILLRNADVKDKQGEFDKAAENCFNSTAINDFLIDALVGDLTYYYDKNPDTEDCQFQEPGTLDPTLKDDAPEGDNCSEEYGVFDLVDPPVTNDPNGGVVVSTDLPCKICLLDEIDDGVTAVVNTGGDDPTTLAEEPTIEDYDTSAEEELDQWINYSLYLAIANEDWDFAEQVLQPLLAYKWQVKLFGIYIMSNQLAKADLLLSFLPDNTTNRAYFKTLQDINLTLLTNPNYTPTTSEVIAVRDIAYSNESSSGYGYSIYYKLTGEVLDMPDIIRPEIIRTRIHISDLETSEPYLYPNPSSSTLNIDNLSLDGNMVNLKVLNLNGSILMSASTEKSYIQLDIQDLSAGIHLIDIEYQDGRKVHKKFIIVK